MDSSGRFSSPTANSKKNVEYINKGYGTSMKTFLDKITPFNMNVFSRFQKVRKTFNVQKDMIDKNSLQNRKKWENENAGGEMGNGTGEYYSVVYNQLDSTKLMRLRTWRRMGWDADVGDALDEIADEAINPDEKNQCMAVKFYNPKIKSNTNLVKNINDEFYKFVNLFRFNTEAWGYFKDFLIEGELMWELVVDNDDAKNGMIGVVRMPVETVQVVREGEEVIGFVQTIEGSDRTNPIYNPEGVVYVNSGMYNEDKTIILPFIDRISKVWRQKGLMEDALVIYRIVRAPERRVFYIDIGKMPKNRAEEYIKNLIQKYHQKKVYDPNTGQISNQYNPISMMEDYFLPVRADSRGSKVETLAGGCLSLDTTIPLLDGRTLTLAQIIEEFKTNKDMWVYGCDPKTGKVVGAPISWAGVTHENAEVMKLTLDNGKTITCTPDHKFPLWNKGKTEAKDIVVGDSIIPLNIKEEALNKTKTSHSKYTQVYDHESQSWKWMHRIIAGQFKNDLCVDRTFDEKYSNEPRAVIHHYDCNSKNNNPSNLSWVNWKDHYEFHGKHSNMGVRKFKELYETDPAFKLRINEASIKGSKMFHDKLRIDADFYTQHSANSKKRFAEFPPEKQQKDIEARHMGLLKFFETMSPEYREARKVWTTENVKKAMIRHQELLKTDADYKKKFYESQAQTMREMFIREPERKTIIADRNKKLLSNPEYKEGIFKQQRINYTQKMLLMLIDSIKAMVADGKSYAEIQLSDLATSLSSNSEFIAEYISANKDSADNKPNFNLEDGIKIHHLKQMVRYFGYRTYRDLKRECLNHNHRIIKIEYLTEKMDVGTLTIDKDEKYNNYHTFALGCGIFTFNSNLAEIEDLLYFVKKMYKGLKIPVSRLSEQSSIFSDGKSGEVARDEIRFAKAVMRLQSQFANGLKRAFMTHLKLRCMWDQYGLEEADIDVMFNEPLNYSFYKHQDVFSVKVTNYSSFAEDEYWDKEFLARKFLGFTDEDIEENKKYKEKNGAGPGGNVGDVSGAGGGAGGGMPPPADMGASEGGAEAGGAGAGAGLPTPPPEEGEDEGADNEQPIPEVEELV